LDWNSLPNTVVKAESVNSFKNRLDIGRTKKSHLTGKLILKVLEAEAI